MMFSFNEKSSLLLIFFLQALIFSTLLVVKAVRNQNGADGWLGIFILLCAFYVCPFMLGYAGWYSGGIYREIMFYVPFQQLLLIPPVLYFYIQHLLNRNFRLVKWDLLHFLPAALYLLYSLVILITDKLILHEAFFYADKKDKDFSTWYQIAGFISLSVYLIASLRVYRNYKIHSFENLSYADAVLFLWAKRFLFGLLILLLMRGVFFLTNPEWAQFGRKFWFYLGFSGLVYYLAFNGYINSVRSLVTAYTGKIPKLETLTDAFSPDESPKNPSSVESRIADEDLARWQIKLEKVMSEDHLFSNPTLTIGDLSKALEIQPKKLSQFIHQAYSMNFNDFVNSYRTKEVIRKMHEGEHNLQTFLGIALDCGFNSKSTFNRAFKRLTGSTPKAYLKKIATKQVSNPDMRL